MFFRLAKAGFSQKRKTLRNSISGGMGWDPKDTGKLLEETGNRPIPASRHPQHSRMVSINSGYKKNARGRINFREDLPHCCEFSLFRKV